MPVSFADTNFLAVLAAAALVFLLGGLWYTALFGTLWVRLHGYTQERIAAMKRTRPPPVFFGGMIVCYLVATFALALIIGAVGEPSLWRGVAVAGCVWLVVAALRMTGRLATDKPLALFPIDAGFDAAALLISGAVLGAWN
jgi:hypothetical protein